MEKRESSYTLDRSALNKLRQALWKTVWHFLKKLKLSYGPAIPFLGVYPEKTRTLIQKDRCTPVFPVALFIIANIWKQCQFPLTEEWKKTCYPYTKEYYSALKRMK